MKRSFRNGLAVVGMAGGMWLLGHAVANAETTATTPDTGTTVTAPADTGTGSTTATNLSSGSNDNSADLNGGNANGGSGGDNGVTGNTGVKDSGTADSTPATTPATKPATTPTMNYQGDPSKPVTSVTIVTGDATANQQANGGPVDNSGNVSADSLTTAQNAASHNAVTQTSTSTNDNKGDDKDGSQNNSSSDQHNSPPSSDQNSSSSNDNHGNDGTNVADSSNDNSTTISGGNVTGGNGGSNSVDINTGLIGNTFNCPPESTCIYNITTGSVTVYQQANGGSVTNSGNVNIGTRTAKKKAAAPPPPPTAVQTAAKKSPAKVLSTAQPRHTLATTGAETSTPLTVGLLALGAGTALTLAGRRRREVQAA